MRGAPRVVAALAVVLPLVLGAAPAMALILFNDGLTHIIDIPLSPGDPTDPIQVQAAPGGEPTTLIVVDGGVVTGAISGTDGSLLQIRGEDERRTGRAERWVQRRIGRSFGANLD